HDRVAVIAPDGRPMLAGNQGRTLDPGLMAKDVADVSPLLDDLRARLRTDPRTYLDSGRSSEVPRVVDFAVIKGEPAIVGLMPIVTDSGALQQPPGEEAILLSVQLLDDDFAHRLISHYLINQGEFRRSPLAADTATYPIVDSNGRFIAFFEW